MSAAFDLEGYWEGRYAAGGNSGGGSYGDEAEYKAAFLNRFVREHEVKSVVEWGCGDGNQLALAKYPMYLGLDISRTAIAQCRERFHVGDGKAFSLIHTFMVSERPISDMAISLDVVFHLVNDDDFERYMSNLFTSAKRFVVIYADNAHHFDPADHVRYRVYTDWINEHAKDWLLIDKRINHPFYQDFYCYARES